MIKKAWLVWVVVLVGCVALVLAGCGGDDADSGSGDAEVFKIGFAADLSGMMASYDTPMRDGAQFAVDEINADGGVNGMQLELIVNDHKGDKALAVQIAQEMIDEGVQYCIGTCNESVIPVNRLMAENEIPSDIGDGTEPNLPSECGDWTFSFVLIDNVQGAAMAEYCYNELGYRTTYLVKSPDDAYPNNLPLYFGDAFEQLGGKVVGIADYKVGAGDFSAQVTKIKSASPQPDCIYTAMFLPDTPTFLKQLEAARVDIPFVGSEANDTKDVLSTGPEALDGMIFPTFAWPAEGSALAEFYSKYEAKTGSEPETVIVANGYDGIMILKAALEASGGEGGAALRDAIANLSGVELTTTDNFTMDPDTRIAQRGAALITMEGDTFTFVKDLPFPSWVPEPR